MTAITDTTTGRQFGRIHAPRIEWLRKQLPEAVIDPDLPIIDTHFHVFDMPGNRYLIEELAADLSSGHRIESTVYVECMAMYRRGGPEQLRPVGETEFVVGVAAMSESGNYGPTHVAAGIVGFAELTLGAAVEEVLSAHVSRGGGRFKGIRYGASWDADPVVGNSHMNPPRGVMSQPSLRAGLKVLAAMGLSFDAWVYFHQLEEIVAVADALPELNIVLGHCGGPLGYGQYAGTGDEVFAQWFVHMSNLAKRPNVSVKLGGMLMRLAAYDYINAERPPTSADLATYWRRYILGCIELFGADRCMFESNFPVEKMGTSFLVLWNAFKRITADATATEKAALFSGTARRFYRLQSGT